MRVRAIISFTTAKGEIPAGMVLSIPDHILGKLAGKVEALPPETPQDAVRATVEPMAIVTPTTCQAVKLVRGGGYRLCGAPLREGVNGHLSCADMFCQVPQSSWHKYDRYRSQLR